MAPNITYETLNVNAHLHMLVIFFFNENTATHN